MKDAAAPMSFKERYPDFQNIARELAVLARHNHAIVHGAEDGALRLHSSLALTFVALERFLRILVGDRAGGAATLKPLLEQASGRKLLLISIEDRERIIGFVNGARIVTMHGKMGLAGESHEMLGRLLPFGLDLFAFVDSIVAAIDPSTGEPFHGEPARFIVRLDVDRKLRVLTPHEDLTTLRAHNLTFGATTPQDDLLMTAEGALSMVLIEAACRSALDGEVIDDDEGFDTLLERAVLGSPQRLRLSTGSSPEAGVKGLVAVRNSLLHGNYEQAARECGCADVPAYFKTHYATEIETIYRIYTEFIEQLGARGAETPTPVA